MDLDGNMLSEVSQKEEYKYHMISLVCVILKKKKTSSQIQRTDWELPEMGGGGWDKG